MINFPTKYPPYSRATSPMLQDGLVKPRIDGMEFTSISGQTWVMVKEAMRAVYGGDDIFDLYINYPTAYPGLSNNKIRV